MIICSILLINIILHPVNEIEIIVTSFSEGKIYGFKPDGRSIIGFPLETNQIISSTPVITDLDGNGKSEIIAGTGMDKKIYVWETNGNPNYIEWGSVRHSARNTGEYNKLCPKIIIRVNTVWNSSQGVCNDIVVESGTLTLNSACTLTMHESAMIIVRPGANLIINGGTILNANIKALPRSSVTLQNNGYIKLNKRGKFSILLGAIFHNLKGNIDITQ